MESEINAQTKKKTCKRQKSNSETDGRGMESFGKSGTVIGVREQNGSIPWDSSRSDPGRNSRPSQGKIYIGKILKRVEFLEQQFLEYAHAHQARLETRLGESKQKEQQFLEAAQELKEELLAALAEEEEQSTKET